MFQCEVREGGDRVRWLKNDTPLQLDHRMTVLPSGGLEIRNVNYPDRGSYSCIAGSLVSSKADLNLKALVANPAPEPPSFLVTPMGRSAFVLRATLLVLLLLFATVFVFQLSSKLCYLFLKVQR